MRGCTGKTGYPSRKEAERAARWLERNKPKSGTSLSAYHCRHCGAFHFGHARKAAEVRTPPHHSGHPAKLAARYFAAIGRYPR